MDRLDRNLPVVGGGCDTSTWLVATIVVCDFQRFLRLPTMGDLPPVDVPACVARAADHYRADGSRVLAAIRAKGGKSREIRFLPNGEVEVGISAIPGKEIAPLAANGITARMLADDDCLNVTIYTYIYQRDTILASQPRQVGPASPAPAARSTMRGSRREQTPQVMQCIAGAAARYSLPLPVFRAVLKTEGGWDGLKKINTNGSYDMGVAQINTIHLPEHRKYGMSAQLLVNDSCTNVHVAAYRLRSEINRVPDFWVGVGNYHSRTPHLNRAYQARVRRNMAKL